jgi:putative intracellular protease/amidase
VSLTEEADVPEHHVKQDLVSSKPKHVLMVVANPAVSSTLGWPVGFWAAELTHPYYELSERGVEVTIASPDGGKVEFDAYSDPRDESKWSAEDLISMGFANTPELMGLLDDTPKLADLEWEDFADAAVGQQVMPWRLEDALRERGANYIHGGLFAAFVVRDGRLTTGQQQYSSRKVAQAVIEALGV